MTTRDYLKRKRVRINLIVYSPIIALLILAVSPAQAFFQKLPDVEKGLFGATFIIGYAILFIWLSRKLTCPNCGYNLWNISFRKKGKFQSNFCPGCALEFESECQNRERA